jgi:hypothetical protein
MTSWRLPDEIAAELAPLSPERWRIEKGGKHFKLKIDNRLVGIMSKGGQARERTMKNALAQIRRAIRGAE